VLADAGAALLELKAVLGKLVREEIDRRIRALEARSAVLTPEELEELRRLLQERSRMV